MNTYFFLFTLLLFTLSCSSGDELKTPPPTASKPVVTKNETAKKTVKEEEGDELLNLIESDDDKDTNALDVEFESIDGSKDTLNNKVAKTEEKKDEPKDTKEVVKPKVDGSNDKLLSQINDLKSELKNKDNKINDLTKNTNMLSNENQALKSIKSQPVTVNLQDKISDEEYETKYNEAYQFLLSKNYEVAISIFENLILSNSQHQLADNAQYWIGEAHFGLRKFKTAILDFEKVFTFSKSNKNEDAQFKIGLCYYLIKDYDNSRAELNRFISKYPKSRNVARAQQIIGKM